MRRVGSAIATLALVTALSTGIVSLPERRRRRGLDDVVAARAAGEGARQRLLLEADELIYANDPEIASSPPAMSKCIYGGRSLQADRVTYDRNYSRVFAEGNAVSSMQMALSAPPPSSSSPMISPAAASIDSLQVEQDISDDGFRAPGNGALQARAGPSGSRSGADPSFIAAPTTACRYLRRESRQAALLAGARCAVIHDKERRRTIYENARAGNSLGVPRGLSAVFSGRRIRRSKRKTGLSHPRRFP